MNELIVPRKKSGAGTATEETWLKNVRDTELQAPGSEILLAEYTDSAARLSGVSAQSGGAIKSHRPTSGVAKEDPNTAYNSDTDKLGVDLRPTTPEAARAAASAPSSSSIRINYIQWDRHMKRPNYTFTDGHCEAKSLEETLDPERFLWGKKGYSIVDTPVVTVDGTNPEK